MVYVMADIHGCYREYKELLEKVDFSENDELYVLGDIVDRGPEPVKVLWDMMMRPNVYPILGNHEYMALTVLEKTCVEITEENVDTLLSRDDMDAVLQWQLNGGDTTLQDMKRLSREEKEDLLEYLQEFSLYEEVTVGNVNYILVHAGLNNFKEEKDLDEYAFYDLIFDKADYAKKYFQNDNIKLVTGHTPTFTFREDKLPLVYEKNGHIALDCGCVYGKKLAIYCLNNGRVEYVDRMQ